MTTLSTINHLYSQSGAAGDLFIVVTFVFGWVPSAREWASRPIAVVGVGLRRLRRFNVRARSGPRPLAYSLAPLRGQPGGLVSPWTAIEAHAGGVAKRRCRGWLGTKRRAEEWGGRGEAPAPSQGNFSIGTTFQKGVGGTGMVKQLHANAVTVLQHTRTPPPLVKLYQRSIL